MRTSNRSIGRSVAVAAALLAGVAVVGSPSSGQAVEPTLQVTPTTIRDGDTFTVSGTGCIDPETSSVDGLDVVIAAEHLAYPNVDNMQGLLLVQTFPEDDGSFFKHITIDLREGFFGPYDDFETELRVVCRNGDEIIVAYAPVTISFLGAKAETTTSTSTPTTSTTSPPAAAPGTAAPATPVAGDPSFTG